MISNIVRGGAQWWQLKENESSFVKMNQLVQQKYLFQIVKCYKWKEIRNSDHDINRKTSKTVSNFKDNYDSNNLTPRQMPLVMRNILCQPFIVNSENSRVSSYKLVYSFHIHNWPALFSI